MELGELDLLGVEVKPILVVDVKVDIIVSCRGSAWRRLVPVNAGARYTLSAPPTLPTGQGSGRIPPTAHLILACIRVCPTTPILKSMVLISICGDNTVPRDVQVTAWGRSDSSWDVGARAP